MTLRRGADDAAAVAVDEYACAIENSGNDGKKIRRAEALRGKMSAMLPIGVA